MLFNNINRRLCIVNCRTIRIIFNLFAYFIFHMNGNAQYIPLKPNESIQIYLVRHAEKDTIGTNPLLTKAGEERARDLAYVLKDAGIQYIHSSDFMRTKQTVKPLSETLDLEIQIYDHNSLRTLKDKILNLKGVHLVSGHSNSTPELVELFGGNPGGVIDEESEFDRLYIITCMASEDCVTSLIRYGVH